MDDPSRRDESPPPVQPVMYATLSPAPATAPPPARATRGPGWSWVALAVILVVGLPVAVPMLVYRVSYSFTQAHEQARYDVAEKTLVKLNSSELSLAFKAIPKKVGPSVVHITTARVIDGRGMNDESRFFFGAPRQYEARGQGSGVIVDTDGHIVTNYHVVNGARNIQVQLSDGRAVPAEVIGEDALTDLAVLKINADGLIAATWGDSDQLQVGSLVWAVGSPFGLDHSVTFGIISAMKRQGVNHNPHQNFLQTDAAVNPGNSGGPLVDSQGNIVGINTAIVGKTFQGISFSIPSSIAREVYEKIRQDGGVARGWLGVQLTTVTEEMAGRLKLPDAKGALVQRIVEGSPAQRAGLEFPDVILQWNGQPVADPTDLSLLVAQTEIGSVAKLVLFRDGREQTVEVTIGRRPSLEQQ